MSLLLMCIIVGSLQCFHLNFFVDKEQTVVNPYKEMNTSLVTMNYRIESVPLTFDKFNAYLQGDVGQITKSFKSHNYNWYVQIIIQ